VLGLLASAAVVVLVRGRFHWDGVLIDLEVYRMGGQGALDGAHLYDLEYPVGGLAFTYTPFSALVFVPFALLSTLAAATVWTLLSMAALARTCVLIAREIPRAIPSSWTIGQAALLLFAIAFLLEPVVATFGFGQVNLIIMWAVLEDLLRRERSRLGGVLIGVAAGIKIIPGIFALFLLAVRRYGDAARCLAVAAGTVAVGFVVLPSSSWEYWTGVAYDSDRVGGVDFVSNQSVDGLLHRLVDGGLDRPLGWLVAAVVIGVATLVAARLWVRGQRLLGITAMAMGALLGSPISWSHHWVWFLVALAALADQVRRRPNTTDWLAVALMATIVAVTIQPVHDETYSVIWQAAYETDWTPLEWLAANAYLLTAIGVIGYGALVVRRTPLPGVGHAELVVLGDDDVVG
jgi:alpha-1,2-mannosyltransferase